MGPVQGYGGPHCTARYYHYFLIQLNGCGLRTFAHARAPFVATIQHYRASRRRQPTRMGMEGLDAFVCICENGKGPGWGMPGTVGVQARQTGMSWTVFRVKKEKLSRVSRLFVVAFLCGPHVHKGLYVLCTTTAHLFVDAFMTFAPLATASVVKREALARGCKSDLTNQEPCRGFRIMRHDLFRRFTPSTSP